MNDKKFGIGGIIGIILGLIGIFFATSTINSDKKAYVQWWDGVPGYNYESPLTGHEQAILALLVVSIIIVVIGAIYLAASFMTDEKSEKNSTNTGATTINTVKKVQSMDTVEELKKFKELLDSNVITQEEFDEKKKQLLNK